MKTKGIGTEYRRKLAIILPIAKGIITPTLVADSLKVSQQEAGRLLSRWHHQGWVKHIKQGVYIPVAVEDLSGQLSIEDPWILAVRLFSPGYIGGFSAVKQWDFSEQLFETTTFFTTKKIKDRHPVIANTRFHLKTISNYKLFGTKNIWRDNVKIAVSDPTKTIIDLLDDPVMVGGMRIVKDVFLEYQASSHFDLDTLVNYAEKIGNKTVLKRLGFLMETMSLHDLISPYNLSNKISAGYSLFDPSVKNTAIVRRWGLRVPAIHNVVCKLSRMAKPTK